MISSSLSAVSRRLATRVPRHASPLFPVRPFSSGSDELVFTEMDEDTGIAILTMNRAPANSLSMEMMQAISNGVKSIEANPKMEAMILASSMPKIFCAGLDLTELHKPDAERLPKFYDSFQQLYFDLYSSRLSTFAAMGGHAPAGGCMLALSCDFRIFSTVGRIGLNESQLGMEAPMWLGQQMVDVMGERQGEKALTLGSLFSADEAASLGLVDEVVEGGDKDSVVEIARKHATKWIAIPAQARRGVKAFTRRRALESFHEGRQKDLDRFCNDVLSEVSQNYMSAYLEGLANRKKK